MKEQKVFHYGGNLEYEFGQFWEFNSDEPNTFGEVIFLGKFIDSRGEKWDIGFQDSDYEKVAVLVYSNQAPCYLSPWFKDLADAREQIERRKDTDYYEAFEEMINRAEAKGLIK
jgi:hypothetical protein|tara:strand:+ start:155 stop:496 length:342 start_codon:yes stop_codon:yes gene_type:complete